MPKKRKSKIIEGLPDGRFWQSDVALQEVADQAATQQVVKTKKVEQVDFLMWVGSASYPTVDAYIAEAEARGPCKRLGKVPKALLESLQDGNTRCRIFLAHDDGLVGDGFIFGYFEPSSVEYICDSEDDVPYELFEYVNFVDANTLDENPRDCGDREDGAYVVRVVNKKFDDGFVIFDRPRILESFDPGRKRFRGMLQIGYGQKLVNKRMRKTLTMVPPSRNAASLVDKSTEWTEEEDQLLLNSVSNGKSLSRAAREVGFYTGRSKNALIYRFRILTENNKS